MSFTNTSDQMFRDAPHSRQQPPRNEVRSQRNDRPPRFQKDGDFSKASSAPSSAPSGPQKGRDGERTGRGGAEQWRNDGRDAKGSHVNSFTSSGRSREQQGPSASVHQGSKESHNGGWREQDGPGRSDAPSFRKNQTNGPKFSNSAAPASDPKGRYEPNNRKKGRPNSGYFDRTQDASGGTAVKKDCTDDEGLGQFKGGGVSNVHLANGVTEHKRSGPIKPLSTGPPPKQSNTHNSTPKMRSGPIKGLKEPADTNSHVNWRAGDQCLALYWEDNKVSKH